MTNLRWKIDGGILEKTFDIQSVRVMNDFEAIGYGIHELEESDLLPLNNCSKNPTGPISLIGPGTGLGEALLFWNSSLSQYEVHSSEVKLINQEAYLFKTFVRVLMVVLHLSVICNASFSNILRMKLGSVKLNMCVAVMVLQEFTIFFA